MKSLFSRFFAKNDLTKGSSTATKPIVVVSGLPRSGTSLMMKMLEAGGIPPLIDGIRAADSDNPNGYYEFERVKKLDKGDNAWLADAQGKVVKIISALLVHLPADYTYRVIFMERALDEVLASQQKMLRRRADAETTQADQAAGDAELAALFQTHLSETKSWLAAQPNISTLYLNYGALIQDPSSEAARIREAISADLLNGALKTGLDLEAMIAMVDPALYRNRATPSKNQRVG